MISPVISSSTVPLLHFQTFNLPPRRRSTSIHSLVDVFTHNCGRLQGQEELSSTPSSPGLPAVTPAFISEDGPVEDSMENPFLDSPDSPHDPE